MLSAPYRSSSESKSDSSSGLLYRQDSNLIEEELGRDVQEVPQVFARFTQRLDPNDELAVLGKRVPAVKFVRVFAMPPGRGGAGAGAGDENLFCVTPNFGGEGDVDVEVVVGTVEHYQCVRGVVGYSFFGTVGEGQ